MQFQGASALSITARRSCGGGILKAATMSRVEQLEQRIAELDAGELQELRAWFERYDADAWDRQIENDSKNGKLRKLVEQALADDRAERSTDL